MDAEAFRPTTTSQFREMGMRPSPLKAILAAILILGAPIAFRAQEHPVVSTLDFLVAQADYVAVGRIVEVGNATATVGPYYRQPIVLAVEQTLKGEAVQRMSFDLADVSWHSRSYEKQLPLSDPESSSAPRHRLLVMRRGGKEAQRHVIAIDLDEAELRVATADLVVLTKPADVIKAAKDEVLRSPLKSGDDRSFAWLPPHLYSALVGTVYEHSDIYVP